MLHFGTNREFWSIDYCGEMPSSEDEATSVGVVVITGSFVNFITRMNKLVSETMILIASSLFAKVYD